MSNTVEFTPPRLTRLLRRQEVEMLTALSTSALYRRMKEGTFPKPRNLGGGVVRWLDADIAAWIDSLDQQAA